MTDSILLSRLLRILQRTLRETGIELEWTKDTSTKNNTRMINIVKVSSEASERPIDQNHAQKDGQASDDTENKENKVSSDKNSENRAQNDHSVFRMFRPIAFHFFSPPLNIASTFFSLTSNASSVNGLVSTFFVPVCN